MVTGSRFRQFFATYVLFSAIIILIAGIAYAFSYRVIRETAVVSGRRDLEFSTRILEARLDDVVTTISQLGSTSEMAQVAQLERPLPYPDYYDVIRFQAAIPRINVTSTFVDNLYVYFFRSRIVVTLSQMALRLPFFFDELLSGQASSFEEWDQALRSTLYRRSLQRAGDPASGESFVRIVESYPLDSLRPTAAIMVTVAEDRFMSYLDSLDVGEKGFVAAFHPTSGLLAASGSEETLSRYVERRDGGLNRFVVLESPVERYGLRFVAAIPNSLFFDQVNLLGSIFIAIIALEILVGVVMGRRFAIRDMAPVRRLLDAVADSSHEPESRDEFELIASSFETMVRRNNTLQEAIERQAPVVRSTFVDHLLTGKYSTPAEIGSAMELAGLDLSDPAYAIVIISVRRQSISNDDEQRFSAQPLVRAVLEEQWRAVPDLHAVGSNTDPGSFAFLINTSITDGKAYRERLIAEMKHFEVSFEARDRVRLLVASSGLLGDLTEIPGRYREVKSVHDYQRTTGESGVVFAPDLAGKLTNRALFDLESETVLSRSVIAGNAEKTEELLRELRDSAETARDLAPHSIELLLEQLEGALLRTLGAVVFSQPEVQQEARRLLSLARSEMEYHGRFDRLTEVFRYLCVTAASASQHKHVRLTNDMKRFLEERYRDSQIGLAAVAEAFRLSPGYVSRFFKEHAGVGLAEYLERYRIGRAMEDLLDSDDPVSEIAMRAGYTNPNTFYKAFRRITGVSAGEYRQRGVRTENPSVSSISTPSGTELEER